MDTMHDANFPEIFESKLSLLTVFVLWSAMQFSNKQSLPRAVIFPHWTTNK